MLDRISQKNIKFLTMDFLFSYNSSTKTAINFERSTLSLSLLCCACDQLLLFVKPFHFEDAHEHL
jgi:hypothetical protein